MKYNPIDIAKKKLELEDMGRAEILSLILYGDGIGRHLAIHEYNRRHAMHKDGGPWKKTMEEIVDDIPKLPPNIPSEYALTALGYEHTPSRPAARFGIPPRGRCTIMSKYAVDVRTFLMGRAQDSVYRKLFEIPGMNYIPNPGTPPLGSPQVF